MKKGRYGLCDVCNCFLKLQRHHIYPKVHFGHRGDIALICEFHHRDFEHYMQILEGKKPNGRRVKKDKSWYLETYLEFKRLVKKRL